MTLDLSTIIAAGIPTLAVIASFVRNESSIAGLGARITSLETRLDARIQGLENKLEARIQGLENRITSLERKFDARIETLDRDLRDWAKITMQHNSDIALLKDRAKLN